jgi:hypothetical protein
VRPRHLQILALLSLPAWGTLLPWVYNKRDPRLFDIPFFYWYQLMWIPLSVLCTLTVYRLSRDEVRP